MKKITLNGQGVEVFYEELDNGLRVCLIPFKDKKNYFASYTTKYGSIHLDFVVDGKEISTVPGIAHFLEHKMFEQEDGIKPFEFFAKTGTVCNASTSPERTRYIVSGTDALEDNINYLIDYVNSPYFTDENVEKEKGIIIEELNMYKSRPDFMVHERNKEAVFNTHPIRLDVGGTADSVNSITKEDLYTCYNAFYNPSNMVLVVGGTFNVEDIMTLVKNNESLSSKGNKNKIELKKIKEKEAVKDKKVEMEVAQLAVSRAVISIKTDIGLSSKDYKYREYATMLLNILYGSSAIFREKLFTSGLVTNFSVEPFYVDNLMVIEFNIETNKPKEVVDKVINYFKTQKITKEELERTKKVWISSIVFGTDIVYSMVNSIVSDLLTYGKIINDRIDIVKSAKLDNLELIRKNINFDNKTVLIANGKKSNNG